MIIYQSRICRADLRANPDVLYIFGDNARRFGMGGQAAAMRNEPNAHGIATKASPGAFFSDLEFDLAAQIIDADLVPVARKLAAGGTVIFPLDGIGTGLSELPTRAPRVWARLVGALLALGIKAVP